MTTKTTKTCACSGKGWFRRRGQILVCGCAVGRAFLAKIERGEVRFSAPRVPELIPGVCPGSRE